MSPKKKRRLLQLTGFIIGIGFGYFRPFHMQRLLPILGIGVGVCYFIFSTVISDEDTDDDTSVDNVTWFPLVQMFMYFLIGGTLSSSLLLALEQLSRL